MLRILRARIGRDERGMALIAVIGIGAVIAILVVSGIAMAMGGMHRARDDQDWNGSLAAAYAGVEDYESRLAADPLYYKYGNPLAPFTKATGGAVIAPPAAEKNPAFALGDDTTWAQVGGSSTGASFRYEVDNSTYGSSGTIRLRATGRVGAETRTIVADLRQQGFIDFLYFTNYEIRDPDISGADKKCAQYAWAGRSASCEVIQFGARDVLGGPVHSNDTMQICGATFGSEVTTANNPKGTPATRYVKPSGCANPIFNAAPGPGDQYGPRFSPVIAMPATNSQLKKETRSDYSPTPGCLYTGPTSITFTADGRMTVRSPWTRATRVTGDPVTSGSAPAACGIPGTGSGELGSAGGATVPVPDNNVIYVQDVPNVAGNPNTPTAAMTATIGCRSEDGLQAGNGIGFPTSQEVVTMTDAYSCKRGDVFVQGTVHGSVTVAGENYVYVTGNVTYADDTRDVLGLVGNNAVWVWNPMKCTSPNASLTASTCTAVAPLLTGKDRKIDAAIISVAHTFQVQNYQLGGPRGTLMVRGAIAQKFRGTVATTSNNAIATGYAKDYRYDARLKYVAPPKFLSPVNTTYGVSVWVETSPAFDSSGRQL
jgi:Tfp pilus assembly protein PilX